MRKTKTGMELLIKATTPRKLKTASQANKKLMPIHKQIATGLKPRRDSISK